MYNDIYAFENQHKLEEICRPLFLKTEISYFEFGHSSQEDSVIRWLSTNPLRTRLIMGGKNLSPSLNGLFYDVREAGFRYYFWDTGLSCMKSAADKKKLEDLLTSSYADFDIFHGFVIIEHMGDRSNVYSFGTSYKNTHMREFYLNNLGLLENFIFYFKERAIKLITSTDFLGVGPSNKINRSEPGLLRNKNSYPNPNSIDIKRFYLTLEFSGNNYLTSQECKTVSLIARGASIKEIAISLNLSTRTVESYLKSAKDRLKISTNTQLISLFWQSPLSKLAFHI